MQDTWDLPIWEFCAHFRSGARLRVAEVLQNVGLAADVPVALVGCEPDFRLRHQLCVEPEESALRVDHLAAVSIRSLDLGATNPKSKVVSSSP